ncbi:MAG TPA: hypothetical protein VMV31_08570 [Terriglobales bacterium]|nr:hypothetical protein [Terriglobales bacterium]
MISSAFSDCPPEEWPSAETNQARVMLQKAHLAATDFLRSFEASRKGKKGGNSTDAEQDQLRAMLVFAAAGLDAMVKRLVRNALPALLARGDQKTDEQLKSFVSRRAKADPDYKFLAEAVSSPNPRGRVIEAWMDDLTAGSLQSSPALERVARAFDIAATAQGRDALARAFLARNQIVHEMDLEPSQNRARRQRSREAMFALTQQVLSTAAVFLAEVEKKLGH